MRRRFAELLIQLGFWSQIVLLLLVDWASLAAFRREPPPWYHVAGLVVVNAVLIVAAVLTFRFLQRHLGAQDARASRQP